MKHISSTDELFSFTHSIKASGKTIGFVPTMGFLHEGHLSLVKEAKKHSDCVILSIFVNPKQFGANEDLDAYPRDLERDLQRCTEAGVDIVYTPSTDEFYPNDFQTTISVSQMTKELCGKSRPTHFDGVTTVVSKLFNVTRADCAVFGQKDFQQCLVIKQMVKDLFIPVQLIIAPIVREADGLAMSSRNKYLSSEERTHALVLSKSLEEAKALIQNGTTDSLIIKKHIESIISSVPSKIDYIEIKTQSSLQSIETIDQPIVIALAVFIGNTRLIDNLLI